MVEHPVVYAQEAEPAKCNVPGDCRAQSSEGGDVVQRGDKQSSDERLGVNCGPAFIAAVVVFQRLYELGEVESVVYLYQQMLWVDEVTKPFAGELEEGGVSAVTVQGLEHRIVSG